VNSLPSAVRIREEGPRDGWQNIDEPFIPTSVKLELIDRLLDSGIQRISVTSLVSPRWVPQLADADALLARLRRRPGVSYEVLVPNQRGLDRLLALVGAGAPVDEVGVVVSASEAHNRANLNRSVAETLEAIKGMAPRLDENGLQLVASVATASAARWPEPSPLGRWLTWFTRCCPSARARSSSATPLEWLLRGRSPTSWTRSGRYHPA
jgi:hydroxymethylglutaryl-CoA lyase